MIRSGRSSRQESQIATEAQIFGLFSSPVIELSALSGKPDCHQVVGDRSPRHPDQPAAHGLRTAEATQFVIEMVECKSLAFFCSA